MIAGLKEYKIHSWNRRFICCHLHTLWGEKPESLNTILWPRIHFSGIPTSTGDKMKDVITTMIVKDCQCLILLGIFHLVLKVTTSEGFYKIKQLCEANWKAVDEAENQSWV